MDHTTLALYCLLVGWLLVLSRLLISWLDAWIANIVHGLIDRNVSYQSLHSSKNKLAGVFTGQSVDWLVGRSVCWLFEYCSPIEKIG